MGDCEHIENCKFLEDVKQGLPFMADKVMERFCNMDGSGCARKLVSNALNRAAVPREMTPAEIEFAKKIIEEGRAH